MSEPQTLPAMVRAKYPGVYDDISDAELDTKVRSKYPGVYDDLPKPSVSVASEQQTPSTNVALGLMGAQKAATLAEQGVRAFLNAPNAPRIIQRAIGAGVRGASTALGAGVGGVPGAVAGAAMSEGLTPTQQTIRTWLGREATRAAASAPAAEDAVFNHIKAMGGDASNLKGAALEYAKKAGRAILYDSSGRASLVPETAATTTKTIAPVAESAAAPSTLAKLARAVQLISGAQGVLDLAQMADPTRTDIGILGVGAGGPVDMAVAKAKTEKSGGYLTKADADADVAAVKKLIDGATPPAAAVKKIAGENPARFGSLMTLYLRSRQVK